MATIREQIRAALAAAAEEWVREYVREHGGDDGAAMAELAARAGIGGTGRPGIRASNLRRLLEGRESMSPERADAIAGALGRRFSLFLE